MTRRDYVFIAEVFASARKVFNGESRNLNAVDMALREAALAGIDYAARRMCDRLAAANPRFDRARFLAAVGL